MTPADWIGTLGVTLLLGAFAVTTLGWAPATSRGYQLANVVGAGLAATASWLIDYMPFVVLETTWCAVALGALVRRGVSRDDR
jgi:hypothetical protein